MARAPWSRVRALVTAAQERFAHRAATRTVAELREQVVAHAVALGPRWLASGEGPAVVTLATRGLDALEPYFVRYLPQLVLAATVTPGVLLVVLGLDWVSAAILVVVLPLVPIFMVLVGRLTQGRSERGLVAMQRLGAQVLDLLAGLPTLRAHGRERGPGARVRTLGDAHREATMGTLRIAFLSGMVLELLTTLSVALVAVGIGLRLVEGNLDLVTGIAVLVLAPEVFLPLRQVGVQFHAAADGVAAAGRAFEVLETPVPAAGTRTAPDLRTATLRLDGRGGPDLGRQHARTASTWCCGPARVVALTGPSGVGKTTARRGRCSGCSDPTRARASIDGVDLADIDPASLWAQVSWLPQRPVLEPGTVAELVGGDDGSRATAAALTGLDAVLATLPDGWAHPARPRRRGPEPGPAPTRRADPHAARADAAGGPRRAHRPPGRGRRAGGPRHRPGAAGRRPDRAARRAPPVAGRGGRRRRRRSRSARRAVLA